MYKIFENTTEKIGTRSELFHLLDLQEKCTSP